MEEANLSRYYLIITPFFPTEESFRGPFIYDLVNAIKRTDKYKDVIVFKSKKIGDKRDSYYYQGVKVYLFPMVGFPSYLLNGCFNGLNTYLFIKAVKKAGIPIQDIAIAHGHTSSFGAFCVALQSLSSYITTVLHHHDPDPYTIHNGRFAQNLINLYVRAKINIQLFEKIDWHLSVSGYVEDNLLTFPACSERELSPSYKSIIHLLQRYNLKSPKIKSSYVLYNGVDLSKFKKLPIKCSKVFSIGCIGNFVIWKNQITLLRAIKLLVSEFGIHNLHAYFVGSGPELSACEKYVVSNYLSTHVEFLQEVDHEKLSEFYEKIDVFCLPSYFEGFGCVFTEAAACGKPFIIGKNQGASEYIIDEELEKWTIDPFDEKQLAHLLSEYYHKRYQQHYKFSFDINVLVADLLSKISTE